MKRNTHQQSKLATISTQTNENKWIGDDMIDIVSSNCTRFWLQNCRGLPTTKDKNRFQYNLYNMVKNNIHYYSLPEASINISNTETVSHIQQVHYNVVQSGIFTITNTPAFPHQHRRQPGGVASGFYGRLENQYAKTVKDKYGRWHYHEYYGKCNQLQVYNLYRFNNYTSFCGDTTAWAQQQTCLIRDGINVNPRQHVIDTLVTEIENTFDSGIAVILLADLNEGPDDHEKTNNKLLNIGLHNILQNRLGTQHMPNKHKRGTKAIDHVWLTANLLQTVEKAGYVPFDTIIENTDHCCIFFDLDRGIILDHDVVKMQPAQFRRLKATIPKRVQKYNDIVSKGWTDHNIESRLNSLINLILNEGMTPTNELSLNNIDSNITEILRHAEKKCCRVHRHCDSEWSVIFGNLLKDVHKARNDKNNASRRQPEESHTEGMERFKKAVNTYNEKVKAYYTVKNKDDEERKDNMLTLAGVIAEQKNTTKSSVHKQLLHIETLWKSNQRV